MHDVRTIRANPAEFDAAMARRGLPPVADSLIALDEARRAAITTGERWQSERKQVSRDFGMAKRKAEDTSALEAESSRLEALVATSTETARDAEARIKDLLDPLPNVMDDTVPDGRDEAGNIELKAVGTRNLESGREHFEIGEALGLMDFATAAKLSGSRFTLLKGALARLERALGQFMIDLHTTEHGYTEVSVPLLVNDAAVYGTNQLPKFADDLFRTTDGRWLIPTAEVPLTNTEAGNIVPEARLPIRLAALSDCFRSEAGSAGRDTRGMLRQHQFKKVELVSLVRPEDSDAEHERMTSCAEKVLELLGLPYRRMLLCAGDTGFGSAKTFDLEVWLPGQGMYREISSCSTMRAFQARRMNARWRAADGTLSHLHTLNGSGVAVGRALIAVLENYQQADGSVAIPDVLRRYMGDMTVIAPS